MPLENFIIWVYCWVDDALKNLLGDTQLRQRGFGPALSDSEMITMEIVAEFLGIDTDKGAWSYFHDCWLDWFPALGSRANYAKHASNLWVIKQKLHQSLACTLGAFSDKLHICDGFPIEACELKRAYHSRCFEDEASYGYCAAKDEKYYGFKGNVLINTEGVITGITLSAANIDERESLWDIVSGIDGMLIADKGLIGAEFKQTLYEYTGVDLQTSVRSNMTETRPFSFVSWLKSTRRLVETVIGQLAERFNMETVRARKLWHLTNRIARKVLAHTLCIFINKQLGNPPLQFELLQAQ